MAIRPPISRSQVAAVALALLAASGWLKSEAEQPKAKTMDGPVERVFLDGLNLGYVCQGWGNCHSNKSVDGAPLKLYGQTHTHGLGTHATSELSIDLKGQAGKFQAVLGVDDEVGKNGTVTFEVWSDDKKLFDSGIMHGGDEPRHVDVNLSGAKRLLLVVTDAGDGIDYDHADWADAWILMLPGTAAKPVTTSVVDEPPPAVAMVETATTAIHGPTVVGTTPGHPFIYLIAATAKGKLAFHAQGLPAGLHLDSRSGIISGSVADKGRYDVRLSLEAENGRSERKLVINAEPGKLALTPPMGWNSWNSWGEQVDAEKIREAADWLVKSGLAAHGYQYINIDDGWEGGRDSQGNIVANSKFPDMKALADYVHERGLKIGIYSSPGPRTCQGLEGSYKHEAQDAKTWADWGIDYLKYDMCSYQDVLAEQVKNPTQADYSKPYEIMHKCLSAQNRDIVYSLCQYGLGKVWEWGAQVGGNSWRTTGDISDYWGSVSDIGTRQAALSDYSGPGHWNDPDMLVVGHVGIGSDDKPKKLHPTNLNRNEQVTHISLWSMLSAPLLIGCDLSQLDEFTTSLLSNDEVIALDQDRLGSQATPVMREGQLEVWSKKLADGSTALALINRSPHRAQISANWLRLGLSGTQPVRDLWQRKNLGQFKDAYSTEVAPHGTKLIKVGKPQ